MIEFIVAFILGWLLGGYTRISLLHRSKTEYKPGETTQKLSPRNGIPYVGGNTGQSMGSDYPLILDSVYEMADQIVSGNGVSPVNAIHRVCWDEAWHLDIRDRLTIRKMLTNSHNHV